MKILAIDYGLKKIGLAIGEEETRLAEPYTVIRLDRQSEIFNKIERIISENEIEMVVVGISEGKMSEVTKRFAEKLGKLTNVKIVFQDETLTTFEAMKLSKEANLKRVKRKKMEDAFAACLILERYFQENS